MYKWFMDSRYVSVVWRAWSAVKTVRRFCRAVTRSSARICWRSTERWLIWALSVFMSFFWRAFLSFSVIGVSNFRSPFLCCEVF